MNHYIRMLMARDAVTEWLRDHTARGIQGFGHDDRGSPTLEQIVITALLFGLAVGILGAITAVVHKYMSKLG